MFEVRLTREAVKDLDEQLPRQPLSPTRNRKRLGAGLVFPGDYEPPIWELRVGEYRVLYDVDRTNHVVQIRAVRRKGRKQTKETL